MPVTAFLRMDIKYIELFDRDKNQESDKMNDQINESTENGTVT